MEIISYFDSKSSFAVPADTLSLEEMLNRRMPSQKRNVKEEKIQHKTTTSAKRSKVKDPFIVSLCTVIKKARYAGLVVCAALFITLCVISGMIYVESYASPLNFHQAVLVEEEVLTESMHNFVSMASVSQTYEEEEALSLLAQSDIDELYSQPVSFSRYIVQSGDSIHSISNKFGLQNISTLIGINNIENVRLLWEGQSLTIPSIDGLVYEVKNGDTLDAISQLYSISIEEILDVNELDSSILHVGDELFIPGARLDTNSLRMAMGELFKHPLSGRWRLSSNYGYRADPFTGVRSFHTGADFAIAQGTPVKAAMSGTVSKVGYTSIYGYYVIVNHHNGYQTLYAHFMKAAPVYQGQSVSQNTVIGYVGSTGYSTGPHLHFSVYKHGELVSPKTVISY